VLTVPMVFPAYTDIPIEGSIGAILILTWISDGLTTLCS